MSEIAPALLIIEALRLDRTPAEKARRQALEALDLGVGGFILFGGRASEVARLLGELKAAAGRPLWIAADLERGAGQQFAGLTSLPPPAALAHAPDPAEAVRAAGEITGKEARELGINWVLAPVLDLDLTGDNPIVGTRSFGSDPSEVARLGLAWIESCQAQGPAACAKHFPGHGRTLADSHLELPTVEASPEELADDLEPFGRTARAVATVMAAHVTYPSLSPRGPAAHRSLPASRDPALLRSLLRDGLGFGGLVVSDALIMGGFGDRELEGPAAAEAVAAGCDLLLYPRSAKTVVEVLQRAVDQDPALADRVSEAAAVSGRLLKEREAASRATFVMPSGSMRGRGDVLAERCIVAQGSPPPGIRRDRPVVVRALSADRERPGSARLGKVFTETLEASGWEASLEDAMGTRASRRSAQRIVLLASSPQAFKGHAGLSAAVEATLRKELGSQDGGPVCLVVLAHLRLLEDLGMAGLCAWSPEPAMERAAARRLALDAGVDSAQPRSG